eukprot:114903_1
MSTSVNLEREVKFVDQKAADEYKCPICLEMIWDTTIITTCAEHIFCELCLNKLVDADLRNGKQIHSCPQCRKQFKSEERNQVWWIDRQINSLKVLCYNKRCEWIGDWLNLEHHIEECSYETINCDECMEACLRQDLLQHKTENCMETEIECEFEGCGMESKRKFIVVHFETHRPEIEVRSIRQTFDALQRRVNVLTGKINKLFT